MHQSLPCIFSACMSEKVIILRAIVPSGIFWINAVIKSKQMECENIESLENLITNSPHTDVYWCV